jgi:uncharacterized protein
MRRRAFLKGSGALMLLTRERRLSSYKMNDVAGELQRVVVWKNQLLDGRDHCALWSTGGGWLLNGVVIGVLKGGKPVLAKYEVHCHKNWQAHDVYLESGMGSNLATLRLHVENAVWSSTGKELKNIKGCELVDLALTPATNTLPIRQLKLEIGSSKSVTAAWVKFPELIVAPLRQRYTRLSETTYRYESNSGFSADIVVDDLGLVTDYPGGWDRIATL